MVQETMENFFKVILDMEQKIKKIVLLKNFQFLKIMYNTY